MHLSQYKSWSGIPPQSNAAGSTELPPLLIRRLGLQDYVPIWQAMRYLAEHPRSDREDEIWLLSHKPVYTQGQAGKAEHILSPGEIPVVQIDRGGQVTYHGPGQLVAYLLIDVKRRKFGVRVLVDIIEQAIIATLEEFGIAGVTRKGAPGVYVNDAKIAALGLRIKNGRSYHGLSLNIDMNLQPFKRINPCGFENLAVTQIADYFQQPVADQENATPLMHSVSTALANQLLVKLGYQGSL